MLCQNFAIGLEPYGLGLAVGLGLSLVALYLIFFNCFKCPKRNPVTGYSRIILVRKLPLQPHGLKAKFFDLRFETQGLGLVLVSGHGMMALLTSLD